jgi:superfamily I DNA/RNA helicase
LDQRLEIETEIASLWDKVDKEACILTILTTSSDLSKKLNGIKCALQELIDSFRNSKGSLEGEFSKRLILSTGVWVKPENLVDDLSSMTDILKYTPPNGPNVVQMMTMRKAKGLEADVVIMVGLEDDIIPNPKSPLEEEARLFYVSMTRARQKLYLIHSFTRPSYISYGPEIIRKKRSRFIDSLGRKSQYYGN